MDDDQTKKPIPGTCTVLKIETKIFTYTTKSAISGITVHVFTGIDKYYYIFYFSVDEYLPDSFSVVPKEWFVVKW